jgi:Protein kinase G tetratricopeptide repeat
MSDENKDIALSVRCPKPPCQGVIIDGKCNSCGLLARVAEIADKSVVFEQIRNVLAGAGEAAEGHSGVPTKEQLLGAASQLQNVVPYNYEAWRLHADLLLNALKQLETRHLMPDPEVALLSVALREDDLRDAAESALRQCARYADSEEKLIATIDEANRVRRITWF